jgi:hypothetical protein
MTIGFDEIHVDEGAAGKIITLKFNEEISKKDYNLFVPLVENQIRHSTSVRILVELHAFKGWTAGAFWEDTMFAAKNFNNIDRLAVVGESRWKKGVTLFVKPFTAAQVRYFEMEAIERARQWLAEV